MEIDIALDLKGSSCRIGLLLFDRDWFTAFRYPVLVNEGQIAARVHECQHGLIIWD